eukprot:4267446-Alexandrium_andersonii.AAC.1
MGTFNGRGDQANAWLNEPFSKGCGDAARPGPRYSAWRAKIHARLLNCSKYKRAAQAHAEQP